MREHLTIRFLSREKTVRELLAMLPGPRLTWIGLFSAVALYQLIRKSVSVPVVQIQYTAASLNWEKIFQLVLLKDASYELISSDASDLGSC
jgi:hypothetical protein